MTIDERLEYLLKSTESLHATQHEMIQAQREMIEAHRQMAVENAQRDARESRGRMAILEGIKKYLEVLGETDADQN